MKKLSVLVLIALTLSLLSCAKETRESSNEEKLSIIATSFPSYDWTRNVLGDRIDDVNLRLLVDSGIDVHSFQPTIDDVVSISECDVFIYIGGASESWVTDALAQAKNKNMLTVNLMDTLGDKVLFEELVEGMQVSEHGHDHDEHGHDHDEHGHDHDANRTGHEDEHVWLSVKNAKLFVDEIASVLAKADSAYENSYKSNASEYIKELDSLDNDYNDTISKATIKTILVADRFPFLYLVNDYALDYYAAFVGCSADTEASFNTIAFLSNKVDELGLDTILMIEGTVHRIPETVKENTNNKNQNIVILNSMQSTSSKDIENGANYISIMQENLEVLQKALY